MVVPPAPVQFPSQRPLTPSVASVANDKGDNEMILGLCTDLLGFTLQQRKNPRKPQLGDRLMKAVRPVIASYGVPFLQMRSVGQLSTSGRENEGNKERTGWNGSENLSSNML